MCTSIAYRSLTAEHVGQQVKLRDRQGELRRVRGQAMASSYCHAKYLDRPVKYPPNEAPTHWALAITASDGREAFLLLQYEQGSEPVTLLCGQEHD